MENPTDRPIPEPLTSTGQRHEVKLTGGKIYKLVDGPGEYSIHTENDSFELTNTQTKKKIAIMKHQAKSIFGQIPNWKTGDMVIFIVEPTKAYLSADVLSQHGLKIGDILIATRIHGGLPADLILKTKDGVKSLLQEIPISGSTRTLTISEGDEIVFS